MNIDTELQTFNALTPERAKEILAAAEGEQPDIRSCWNCNASHEHLKTREVLMCFACGIYYLQGYPAQFVIARSRGNTIALEDLAEWKRAVEES